MLALVDFAAVAAVAAAGLDLKQLVKQAEGRAVVSLVAVVFPLVNEVVGSSPHRPRQTHFCLPFFVSQF